MPQQERKDQFFSNFLPLILLALIAGMAVLFSRQIYAPCDDAYIFLVYAKNFLQGNGLTFNGMIVEGFSSPLWLALLILFGYSKIDLPILMQILSSSSGVFALFATYTLSNVLLCGKSRHYKYWSLLAPALLAATGDFAFYLGSGLEQTLFTSFIALSVAIYEKDRIAALNSFTLPFIFALSILTRPEGALIAMMFYIFGVIETKSLRPSFLSGLKLTAILAPILIMKRLYFGYWLPNTYYVKSGSLLANIDHGKIYLLVNAPRYLIVVAVFAILLILSLRSTHREIWQQAWGSTLIGLTWGLYIYLNGGDNLVGGRMLLPVLPLVYAVLVTLLQGNQFSLPASIGAISVISIILFFGYTQDHYIQSHIARWNKNYTNRMAAGLYLKENYPPDTLIALNAAGIIPYYSGLLTIDMLGLNNEYIAHYGKRDHSLPFGHQAGDGEYVLSQMPDIIFFGGTASENPSSFISDREIAESDLFSQYYVKKAWRGIGYAHVLNTSDSEVIEPFQN